MPKKSPPRAPTESDIHSKIKPVAEHERYMAALLYGRSGTGKTALASTFPKPALLLDIRERGTDTVASVPDLDVLEVEKWEEIEEVYWFLQSGKSKYRTVIIDQITQLQDLAMAKIKQDEGMDPLDTMSKRDWGTLSGLTKQTLFNYRDLVDKKLNVVFIAHEREVDVDDTEGDNQLLPSIGPRLMPSVASAMCGAASMIGHTFIRERFIGPERVRSVEYCLRIGPHALYLTKVRHSVDIETPDIIVNPSYEKLVAVIRGEKPQPKVKRSK